MVFIPLSEDLLKAKRETQKTTAILISGRGRPSVDQMVEGLKAMSERLKLFQWKPFTCGKESMVEFPDEKTLDLFASRSTPLSCPGGTFRVYRWKMTEDRSRIFRFHLCRWIIIRGLPPFAWSRNTWAMIVKKFGHLIELDPATDEKSRLDRARMLVGCQVDQAVPPELEVVIGGERWPISIEIESQAKKRINFDPSPELRQPARSNLSIFQWAKKSTDTKHEGQQSTGQGHVTVQANSTRRGMSGHSKEKTDQQDKGKYREEQLPTDLSRERLGDMRESKRLRASEYEQKKEEREDLTQPREHQRRQENPRGGAM